MENQQRPIILHTFDNPQRGIHQRVARRFVPGKMLGKIIEGVIQPEPLFSSKEEAKKYIEDRITARRNGFIAEYRQGFHGSNALTYEPALDREVYKELRNHKEIHADAYREALKGLNAYTRFQVETFIGERLNVGLSKFAYDLRFTNDGVGVMYGQGMDEPLLQMIARGKDCRNEVAEDIDHPRQIAEVTQFERIQEVLGNPETAIGTTIVSFSPPGKEGSTYSHNFYDVFILKEKNVSEGLLDTTKKERYIEARRYASGLSIEESLQKADELQPGYAAELKSDEEHVDAFLISNPVVLKQEHEFFNQPDRLHKELQGDRDAMSYEDFQKKVVKDEVFSNMVNYYLQTLEDRPEDTALLDRTLNAIMNRADEAAGLRQPTFIPRRIISPDSAPRGLLPIMAHINNYGMQEVRQATTGCGLSGAVGQENSRFAGYGANRQPGNTSPTKSSALLSGEDNYGKRTFECPECHETNVRPYNELVPACQHCGSTKVAC